MSQGKAPHFKRGTAENGKAVGGLGPEQTLIVHRAWMHSVSQTGTLPKELSRQLILLVVGACHLTVREGSNPPPPPKKKPAPTSWNLHHNTTQQYGPHTTVWALDSPLLHLHKTTYWPLILMCPCIIDFIGGNVLLGWVGGGGPGHSWAQMALASLVPFKGPGVSRAPSPPLTL